MEKPKKNFHTDFDFKTYSDFVNDVGKKNVTKTLESFMQSYTTLDNNNNGKKINLEVINLKIQAVMKQKEKAATELQNLTIEKQKILDGKETEKIKEIEKKKKFEEK